MQASLIDNSARKRCERCQEVPMHLVRAESGLVCQSCARGEGVPRPVRLHNDVSPQQPAGAQEPKATPPGATLPKAGDDGAPRPPAKCRHCGRVCASAQGRAKHEGACAREGQVTRVTKAAKEAAPVARPAPAKAPPPVGEAGLFLVECVVEASTAEAARSLVPGLVRSVKRVRLEVE